MEFDFSNITLAGLAIIGVVNGISIFKPDLDSRWKYGISIFIALAIGFIPDNISSEIFRRLIEALTIATASSGAYKLSTKLGGDK